MVLNARPSQRCTYTPNFVFISQIIQEICSEHDSKNKVTGQDPGHSGLKMVCDATPSQDTFSQ